MSTKALEGVVADELSQPRIELRHSITRQAEHQIFLLSDPSGAEVADDSHPRGVGVIGTSTVPYGSVVYEHAPRTHFDGESVAIVVAGRTAIEEVRTGDDSCSAIFVREIRESQDSEDRQRLMRAFERNSGVVGVNRLRGLTRISEESGE